MEPPHHLLLLTQQANLSSMFMANEYNSPFDRPIAPYIVLNVIEMTFMNFVVCNSFFFFNPN